MTNDEFVEALAKLDWWPGIIEMEMQLYGMTKTPVYKTHAAMRIVKETKIWVAKYANWQNDPIAGATKREREFYAVASALLSKLG
jgi:hypothetical protein